MTSTPPGKKEPAPPVFSVIVGAGSGERFGGKVPKAFVKFSNGEQLIHATLRRMALSPVIMQQVVVVPAGYEKTVRSWPDVGDLRIADVVAGGKHRSASVMNGLAAVERLVAPGNVVVLIHDAARPCITPALIKRVADGAAEKGNATPTVPLADTVKKAKNSLLLETLDRDSLAAIQTPQGFLLSEHLRMLKLHPGPHLDDTIPWSMEGKNVFRVEGERWNVKITFPKDLRAAEALMAVMDTKEKP
jgi:2-C-methyl-D-erythritol 4-phosphate cytidylyltransferase